MSGIGIGMHMAPQQKQTLLLAPRMIQSMEILQLPIADLQAKIEKELQENPFLEQKEKHGEQDTPTEIDPNSTPLKHDETGDLEFSRLDELNRDWDNHFNEEHRVSRSALDEEGDRKLDAMANMANRPQSLQDHLAEQLGEMELDEEQRRLAKHICSFIDRTGYLGTRVKVKKEHKGKKEREKEREREEERERDLDGDGDDADEFLTEREREKAEKEREREREEETEVFRSVPLTEIASLYDPPTSVEEVEDTLIHVVQKLEPPGVGARDLRECLLLQLTPEMPLRDALHILIRDHLEDIANNRIPVIHKATRFDIPTIHDAIAALQHLDPKPGLKYAETETRYVMPDVIVERNDDDDFNIRLTDEWVPRIRISKRTVELIRNKDLDDKVKEELRKKLQSADWLVKAVEQRRNTLLKVTRAIIEHQRPFLDAGPEYIQPLKMQQIADQVKVHVTTVSRAVDDKWVQTPRGVFPLKRFFGGGKVNNQTGEDVAFEVMKQKLMELVSNEDKANPLSDEELVARLRADGYPVARRTVTKYRKMLKIPSSRQRKDWSLDN